jgi:hypothetical protein
VRETARPGERDSGERWLGWDWAAAAFLFLATAGVVVWQNSRLGILWDLSYVLENSYRISLGDIPYRDFPFPFPPLTFLIQALLIRVAGRVYFHHVLYCAVVGGLGSVLTWRILTRLLSGTFALVRLLAFLLALPLTLLGIYSVFPHPFYDPDCTFAVLLAVFLLERNERKGFSSVGAFFAGVVLVVPVFVKQSEGLAFLASAGFAIVVLAAVRLWRRGSVRGYAWLIAGIAAALGVAVLAIQFKAGLRNYRYWTIQFAAARRLPGPSPMLEPFKDPLLPWWIATFAAGATLLWLSRRLNQRWLGAVSVALLSAPFVWPAIYLFVGDDPADRAERLLGLWPFLMIAALACAVWNIDIWNIDIRNTLRGSDLTQVLPFVLIATVEGAFLSQQLWGSTYSIWPLLILLFAGVLGALAGLAGEQNSRETVWFAGVAAVGLLVSGAFYTASHERLNYSDLSDGELTRSTLPALMGLRVRGPWIPQFEELVRFSEREIPRNQGMVMIPGEDLFYYATGRRPRFPVVSFDHTINPYSPEEIVEIARRRNICWLVVKKNLQLNADPVEDRDGLLRALRVDFAPVQSLANYDVYRREPYANCADGATVPMPTTGN